VFYFGNAIGETGDDADHAIVNATDEIAARNNPRSFNNLAPVTSPHDFNRDGFVNATDQILARSNSLFTLAPLTIAIASQATQSATLPAALVLPMLRDDSTTTTAFSAAPAVLAPATPLKVIAQPSVAAASSAWDLAGVTAFYQQLGAVSLSATLPVPRAAPTRAAVAATLEPLALRGFLASAGRK
jgi:hypothetical protein